MTALKEFHIMKHIYFKILGVTMWQDRIAVSFTDQSHTGMTKIKHNVQNISAEFGCVSVTTCLFKWIFIS